MPAIQPEILSPLSLFVIVGVAGFVMGSFVGFSLHNNGADSSLGGFSDENLADKFLSEFNHLLPEELTNQRLLFAGVILSEGGLKGLFVVDFGGFHSSALTNN